MLVYSLADFLRSVAINRHQRYLLFLGAGASITSGIPGVEECILDLKKIKLLNPDPRPLNEALEIVGHPDHQYLADCLRKQVMPENLFESGEAEA